MYESPINISVNEIVDDVHKREEEQLIFEIKKTMGYSIDKEELMKALQYDRGQYEKGYADGVRSITKTGHWITTRTLMHDGEYYCNICNCDSPKNEKWDYCPNCGAKMKGEG